MKEYKTVGLLFIATFIIVGAIFSTNIRTAQADGELDGSFIAHAQQCYATWLQCNIDAANQRGLELQDCTANFANNPAQLQICNDYVNTVYRTVTDACENAYRACIQRAMDSNR